MDMKKAFQETLSLAHERGMHLRNEVGLQGESLTYRHLVHMHDQVHYHPERYSEAKLGRWLGWAQAAVVAAGVATLEEMKAINKRNSGPVPALDGATNESAPEYEIATAGEFAARWNTLESAQREAMWERIRQNNLAALNCFQRDHDGLAEQLGDRDQRRATARSEIQGLLDSLDSHVTQDEIYSALRAIQEAL